MLKSNTRRLDNTLYPKKAVAEARMAYRDYCDFLIKKHGNDHVTLTISIKSNYSEHSRQIILEFWNYLLDTSCQVKIED
ncbi:hypothetical protein HGB07_01320 [Candidatus Roizmanbacteria bacterium]|nr:hypothetical protein [Candidatus Roizmanbacteria bacterium]